MIESDGCEVTQLSSLGRIALTSPLQRSLATGENEATLKKVLPSSLVSCNWLVWTQEALEVASALGESGGLVKVRLIGSEDGASMLSKSRLAVGSGSPMRSKSRLDVGSGSPIRSKSRLATSSRWSPRKVEATEPANRSLRRAVDHFDSVFSWAQNGGTGMSARSALRKWTLCCEAHQLLSVERPTTALSQFSERFEKSRATIEKVPTS